MTKILVKIAVGLLAVTAFSTTVFAQDMGEVTVLAKRSVTEKMVGRTASGIPIIDVSLSYGVSSKGLDLTKHADVLTLQKRVSDAAVAACKELDLQYPDSKGTDINCAKTATDKAMVQVNELVAAAGKK